LREKGVSVSGGKAPYTSLPLNMSEFKRISVEVLNLTVLALWGALKIMISSLRIIRVPLSLMLREGLLVHSFPRVHISTLLSS
jgi:hypothetical protein